MPCLLLYCGWSGSWRAHYDSFSVRFIKSNQIFSNYFFQRHKCWYGGDLSTAHHTINRFANGAVVMSLVYEVAVWFARCVERACLAGERETVEGGLESRQGDLSSGRRTTCKVACTQVVACNVRGFLGLGARAARWACL